MEQILRVEAPIRRDYLSEGTIYPKGLPIQRKLTREELIRDEESQLVRSAMRGDKAAFSKLYDKYSLRLYNFIRGMVRVPDEAEDLTNETFLKAWTSIKRLKDPERFKSWLYRIANNACLDSIRKRKPQVADLEESHIEAYVDPGSPGQNYEAGWRTENIKSAIEALKPEFREVILLCDIEGMSYQEVSRVLKIPFGTVQSRLFYARKRIKQYLEKLV